MTVLQQLFVILLLETGLPVPDQLWEYPGWLEAQHKVLIWADLLNPQWAGNPDTYEHSFEDWQTYYREAKGFPASHELQPFLKFVSLEYAEQQLAFSDQVILRWKNLAELHASQEQQYTLWIFYLQQHQKPWKSFRIAYYSQTSVNLYWMRSELHDLRECLGNEAFFLGELPSILPLEHWRRLP